MGSPDRIDPLLAADIDRLATVLAKDPRSKAFMPLAESYIKAGMWQEAAAVLEDGLAVYPGFITAMAALGRVYDQLGQPAKAKTILEDVVKQSPDNLRAHRILARIFSSEGNAESALKSCAAILAASPYDQEALSIQRALDRRPFEEGRVLRKEREHGRATVHHDENPEPAEPPTACFESVVPAASEPTDTALPSRQVAQVAQTAAAVARLEAWLSSIRSRRRI